jgi:hypothetical protein
MNILRAGTIKRIHVDRHVLARNRKLGTHDPAWTIQTSKGAHKARWVEWKGATTSSKPTDKPLKCGARMWVETKGQVTYY